MPCSIVARLRTAAVDGPVMKAARARMIPSTAAGAQCGPEEPHHRVEDVPGSLLGEDLGRDRVQVGDTRQRQANPQREQGSDDAERTVEQGAPAVPARKTPIAKRATAMNGSHVPSVFRRR